MLKTLLAGTALTALLTFAAQAQETPEAQATPDALPHSETMPPREVGNQQMPSTTSDAPATPSRRARPRTPTVPQSEEPPIAADGRGNLAARHHDARRRSPRDGHRGAGGAGGPLPEGWTPVDLATVSPDTLIGADIRTYDQDTVAAVEDVLMSPDGKVESVVARFGGFLGFGETTVLLTPRRDRRGRRTRTRTSSVLTSLTAGRAEGAAGVHGPRGRRRRGLTAPACAHGRRLARRPFSCARRGRKPLAERRKASPKPVGRQRKDWLQGGDAAMPDFIDIRDARFAKLIHGSARIDKLWTGGRWAEGPAYLPAGTLPDLVRHPQRPADALGRDRAARLGLRAALPQPERPYRRPRGAAPRLRAPRPLRQPHRAGRQPHRSSPTPSTASGSTRPTTWW